MMLGERGKIFPAYSLIEEGLRLALLVTGTGWRCHVARPSADEV
ncbi:hypothetical protein [Novosphingobium sp. SCN 63-17]|nr:hypothetical protein [Novosphingobium sp. SCN 63-17]